MRLHYFESSSYDSFIKSYFYYEHLYFQQAEQLEALREHHREEMDAHLEQIKAHEV